MKSFYWAQCHDCKVQHPIHLSPNDVGVHAKFSDFANNHQGHAVGLIPQAHTYLDFFRWSMRDLVRKAFWQPVDAVILAAYRARAQGPIFDYRGNADVKEAFQGIVTDTITNFSGLATSATAGWQSAQIDNTANLYLDTLMQFTNTAVNTAAANSKAIFFFAFGGNATGVLTNFGAAVTGTSEATLTFPDVTANPVPGLVYVQPYTTTNIAMASLPFSIAAAFSGVLPSYWGVAAVNHSGMTLGTVTMKHQGEYNTVV